MVILPSFWHNPGLGHFGPSGAYFRPLPDSLGASAVLRPAGAHFGFFLALSARLFRNLLVDILANVQLPPDSQPFGPSRWVFRALPGSAKMLAARCARTETFNAIQMETQVRSCQRFKKTTILCRIRRWFTHVAIILNACVTSTK